jgi:hypothetical protein
MTHDVFFSYSTKDKTIADTIVALLEQNDIRCWYAPRDIKPNDDWGKAISDAIEQSKVFLLIFSGNSNRSPRVLDELNLAISQEIPVLPFRIENLEPDGAMRLHLSSRHWLDAFDPSWESHLKKLVASVLSNLEISIDEEKVELPEIVKRDHKKLKRKEIVRILAGFVISAMVISMGWFALSQLSKYDEEIQEMNAPATKVSALATQTSTAPTIEEEEKTQDIYLFSLSLDIEKMNSKLNEAKTWNLVLLDTFDQNNANWILSNVDDDIKKETTQIENGVLLWGLAFKKPDNFWYYTAPVGSYSNFYYSIRIKRIGGTSTENNAAWGMLFRRHGSNYYTFRLNDNQEYSVQIHNKDGWVELIGWTRSQFLKPDDFNELTVIADDADMFFFINGTPIGIVNNQTYSDGNVGYLAGLNFVDDKEVLFEFDDFELRQKPDY